MVELHRVQLGVHPPHGHERRGHRARGHRRLARTVARASNTNADAHAARPGASSPSNTPARRHSAVSRSDSDQMRESCRPAGVTTGASTAGCGPSPTASAADGASGNR